MSGMNIEKCYTSREHLLKVFERESRKLGLLAKNIDEYNKWKIIVRQKLIVLTGLNKMETCSLKPKLLGSEQFDKYRRDKFIIQTEPDVWMPVYILIPNGLKPNEKKPCIIAPHGHNSGGKYAVSGRYDIPKIKEKIEEYNYDYGVKFVEKGYIVLCPDARGSGERIESYKPVDDEEILSTTCIKLNNMAMCMGQTVTGMYIWDLMRLIDYIELRSDCDINRIACCGLSGGGHQTLWLAALDDRIRSTVVSGYFSGYKDTLLKSSCHCTCIYIPHLLEYVDIGDIGALIAPRPLLIESGNNDFLNGNRGIVNVIEQLEVTKLAYRLCNAENHLCHYIFEGGHVWNGNKTYDFVNQWL